MKVSSSSAARRVVPIAAVILLGVVLSVAFGSVRRPIAAAPAQRLFMPARDFAPAWVTASGQPSARSADVVRSVKAGVPAQIVTFTPEKNFLASYEMTDFGTGAADDTRAGTTEWRIILNSGNCCENHITTSKEGRIFDIGGSYIRYSDDRGVLWKSVQPLEPLVNGEGSMAMAPNGDVVAMTWDPYSGDHFVAYKYDAAAGTWSTLENFVHQPVYDRPWLTVVPGPFPIALGSVPYISFVQGGTGVKDPLWVSTDGLSYVEASSLFVDGQLDQPVTQWFPIQADPSFDWIQPIRSAPVTPLGAGRAIAAGGWLLDPQDHRWDQWRLPDPPNAQPPTYVQIDSAGRINHVRSVAGGFEYRLSNDGGQTWTTSGLIPFSLGTLYDFRANFAAGVGAVAARVGNQDWVYKIDIAGTTPRLARAYKVGLGDTVSASGVQVPPRPRFDFKSIAILPDGKVVSSFFDSTTFSHPSGSGGINGVVTPALAIEGDTTLPPPTAVTVGSFRAERSGAAVVLRWRTASEVDVAGFDLYRGRTRLSRSLIPARFAGQARGASYRFRTAARATRYTLRVVRSDGSSFRQEARLR